MRWLDCYKRKWIEGPKDRHDWIKEISTRIARNVTDGELADVLESYASVKGPTIEKITAEFTKINNTTKRKENQQKNYQTVNAPGAFSCRYCRFGWLDYWPQLGDRLTISEAMDGYSCAIPCDCPAGVDLYGKPGSKLINLKGVEMAELKAMAPRAKRQHDSIAQSLEGMPWRMADSPAFKQAASRMIITGVY